MHKLPSVYAVQVLEIPYVDEFSTYAPHVEQGYEDSDATDELPWLQAALFSSDKFPNVTSLIMDGAEPWLIAHFPELLEIILVGDIFGRGWLDSKTNLLDFTKIRRFSSMISGGQGESMACEDHLKSVTWMMTDPFR
jgi:hypothetical protein